METKEKFKLDFIGFAVNRSATGWIHNCLKEHPEICASVPKETHFFSKNYGRGPTYLRSCFQHCLPHQIKGEYSPEYITDPLAPKRIKEHFPNIKLIASLRNPISRMWSSFWLDKSRGKIRDKTLIGKLEREPWLYIEKGKYSVYLKRWMKLFPRENLLIVLYADIRKKPLESIQKIYKFLGAAEDFVPQSLASKRMVGDKIQYRVLALNQLYYGIRKKLRTSGDGSKIMKALKGMGINDLAKFIFKLNSKKVNDVEAIKRPAMPIETKKYLLKIYKDEIDSLEDLINRDLSAWRQI
jgi:hypothetical protein